MNWKLISIGILCAIVAGFCWNGFSGYRNDVDESMYCKIGEIMEHNNHDFCLYEGQTFDIEYNYYNDGLEFLLIMSTLLTTIAAILCSLFGIIDD